MVGRLKRISILLLLTLIITLTACSEDDGSEYIFKYDVFGNPSTLDPQKAVGETAALVITNIFDGLLKLDENGNISPAVAGEYSISDDGLTYRFYLREDVYWTDKNGFSAQCTAKDFVYGFVRLFNPAVKSLNAEKFFCIKNSQKVNKGQISDIYDIGVKAIGDFELIIELDYPNPIFLNLLTTSPAMPCNEEFYLQSDGRYGLVSDGTPSNGAFYLEKWNYDYYSDNNNNIILRKNKKNSDGDRVYPYGINFFINEDDIILNFKENNSHSVILCGEDGIALIKDGNPHYDYENSVWGIVFNTNGAFKNKDLRYGLSAAIRREKIKATVAGYRLTDTLIPEIVRLGNIPYRALVNPEAIVPYSSELAKERFNSKNTRSEEIDGLTLIIPKNDIISDYISYILQQWQSELGFYCNVKILSENEYQDAINKKAYDFAAVKLSGDYNSPSAFFNIFTGTAANYSGYYSPEYSEYIYQAERAADITESAELYYKAESLLLTDAVFIPICFQTEYFIYNKNCVDIIYNPFTRTIDYRAAKYIK